MTTTTLTLAPSFTSDLGYLSHPMAIGAQASESSYLSQHPMCEPYVAGDGGAVLRDNGQDLEATIGLRTVRLHAFDGAAPGIVEQHNLARAVVGMTYKPSSWVDRLSIFDEITAPFGGRDLCGAARILTGKLRYPHVFVAVTLPTSISAILSVDGVHRGVEIIERDSDDGSSRKKLFCVVHNYATGGALVLRGTSLDTAARHVGGSLSLGKKRAAKLAKELPARIAQHAEVLRTLAAMIVDEEEMHRLCLVIAAFGDEDVDEDTATDSTWIRACTLASLVQGADGKKLPASPLPGHFTGLQLFEAASLVDATNRSKSSASRQLKRIVAGEKLTNAALKVLASFESDASFDALPANYVARYASAENLPELAPLPEGLQLPAHVDVAALRLLWVTALAPSDADADMRIDQLQNVTDPLHVLSIVAPYVIVTDAPEALQDAA